MPANEGKEAYRITTPGLVSDSIESETIQLLFVCRIF